MALSLVNIDEQNNLEYCSEVILKRGEGRRDVVAVEAAAADDDVRRQPTSNRHKRYVLFCFVFDSMSIGFFGQGRVFAPIDKIDDGKSCCCCCCGGGGVGSGGGSIDVAGLTILVDPSTDQWCNLMLVGRYHFTLTQLGTFTLIVEYLRIRLQFEVFKLRQLAENLWWMMKSLFHLSEQSSTYFKWHQLKLIRFICF